MHCRKLSKKSDTEQISCIPCYESVPTTSGVDFSQCWEVFRATGNDEGKTGIDREGDGCDIRIFVVYRWRLLGTRRKSQQNCHRTSSFPSHYDQPMTYVQKRIPSGEQDIPEKENMQIWWDENQKSDKKWNGEKWIENTKWKFAWKWCGLRPISLLLLLLFTHWPSKMVAAKSKNSNNGFCEQYNVPMSSLSGAVPSTSPLFARPCRCAPDWRSHFCTKAPSYKSLLAVPEKHWQEDVKLPTVCICRQLTAENICQQFMAQCFSTSVHTYSKCSCCFNQPSPFCNQLPCHNGEPVFDATANTTCNCYSPDFYPYNICVHQTTPLFEEEEEEETYISTNGHHETPHYTTYPLHVTPMQREQSSGIRIFGIHITPAIAFIIVLGLLGAIVLLTMALLLARTCRTHREHRNRASRREKVQTVLLQQRAEEEKYLP